MSSDIAYGSVPIPTEKSPTEYTYVERRAELLQRVQRAGHPYAINQTELAERYGVSQQQISKDMDRLAEYVDDTLGEKHRFVIESVFQGAMLQLVEEDEPYRAAQVARWWAEWLGDVGVVDTTPAKVEHSAAVDWDGELDEKTEAMIDQMTRDAGGEATDVSPEGHRGG